MTPVTAPAPTPDAEASPATAPDPDLPDGLAAQAAPPLPWLLGYRVLGLRLPEQYRPWIARDILTKPFLFWRMSRTFVWLMAFVGLYVVAMRLVANQTPSGLFLARLALVAVAVSLLASGQTLVRRTLRWQRVNRHGRPVSPKGYAVVGNAHAALLAAAVLTAFTGGVSVFAWSKRPVTVKCDEADDEVMTRLRLGLKNPDTTLSDTRQVETGNKKLVAVKAKVPGETQTMYWLYLFEGDNVLELREGVLDEQSPTSFPAYGGNIDRGLNVPLQRIALCLDVNKRRP